MNADADVARGVGASGDVGVRRFLRRPQTELVLFAALGALQTIAFVDGDLWPLQIIAIALLAWRVGASSVRRAAALGFVFGVGWLCAGTWWLYISMHRYGGLSAALAALAVLALAAFLSLYLAAAMAIVARWHPGSHAGAVLLFAAVWLLAELARGEILTGFPWVASGYAQVDSPLAGFASSIGVYGVGAVVAGLAAGFGFAPLRHARAWLAPGSVLVIALVAGAALGRIDYTTPTRALTISLLQGNVPQQEKFEPQHREGGLAATAAQLATARGELVVGPETVIPVLLSDLDDAYWTALVARFRVAGRAAILGIPMGDPQHGYTNSALGLSASTTPMPGGYYRYDKHHLVPFGEFVPLGFHWFTRMMNIPLGDFNRGPLVAPSFDVDGERIAPNICYEDLFGEELAARFVAPANAPTILANLSNIGWFGRTIAVEQHLRISRMRSLELQRPMIRATNTGATAVIDHHGVVTHALPPFSVGILEGTVEGRQGLTPFAHWAGRFGLWPLWAIGIGLVLVCVFRPRPEP